MREWVAPERRACGCASTTSTGCGSTRARDRRHAARGTSWPSWPSAVRAAATPRRRSLIAESDLNDPRMVAAAGERRARHATPSGATTSTTRCTRCSPASATATTPTSAGRRTSATAYRRPFVYDGRYSRFRGRRHGAPADGSAAAQFVVSRQNHDQVGNRAARRPAAAPGRARLAAAGVDPAVALRAAALHGRGVRRGRALPVLHRPHRPGDRRRPPATGGGASSPPSRASAEEVPDPQDPETFARSKLDPASGEPGDARRSTGGCSRCAASLPRRGAARCDFDEDGRAGSRVRRGAVEVVGNFGDRRRGGARGGTASWCWRPTPGAELRDGRRAAARAGRRAVVR